MPEVRIQKHLAKCGFGSRRACEELVLQGRVKLNGQVVTQLGTKCDPEKDLVEVDGVAVRPPARERWIVFNKPRGCLTTVTDPFGRPTVMHYLSGIPERVFPVGRLDYDTSGLLLFTTDGELAFSLMHPSRGVGKVYDALVAGVPGEPDVRRLEKGIVLDDGPTSPAKVHMIKPVEPGSCLIRLEIHEGRKRQVKRMLAAIGHPVKELTRVAIGPIELGDLPEGKWRDLSEREVRALREAVK